MIAVIPILALTLGKGLIFRFFNNLILLMIEVSHYHRCHLTCEREVRLKKLVSQRGSE